MNILLVLTGGTICTSVRGGLRALDTDGASLRLLTTFRESASPFAHSTRFHIGAQFHTLSENMTVDVWNKIAAYLRTVDFSAFDGIIIAHGTDTLAYTASMFAFLLAGTRRPVMLVSSNAPLERGDALENGDANFRAAVECIAYGVPPGVWVPYRNPTDRRMFLHMGARLKQCADYSEDFHSVGALDITELSPDTLSALSGVQTPGMPLLSAFDAPLSDCVLLLRPYVGARYDAYRTECFKAVLHGTYHSGTTCVGDGASDVSSVLYLLERCAGTDTDLYLSPAWDEGELYDTVPAMLRRRPDGRRIIPLHGTTEEAAYCKLLLWHSWENLRERVPDFLSCNFCGESIE